MGYTVSWEQIIFSKYTYSNVISVIAKVINPEIKFRCEGWGFIIGNDDDNCACITKDKSIINWVKTNRAPYTKEFMKALIIMVEYGAAINLDHDESDMTIYLEALDEVNDKHPLESYKLQKEYFIKLSACK